MPSPVDKLKNILKLEIDNHYTNRAVIGGVDKIITSWVSEARDTGFSEEWITKITDQLSGYGNVDVAGRAAIVSTILDLLNRGGGNYLSPAANRPSPPTKAPKPVTKPAPNQKPQPFNFNPVRANKPIPGNLGLNSPLTAIPRVGPSLSKTLASLELHNLEDLLYYFPRRYVDYSKLKQISKVELGEELTLIGTLEYVSSRPYRDGKQKIIEAALSDGTGSIRLTWFNQYFLEKKLKPGQQISVAGKIETYLGRPVMVNPYFEYIDQEHLTTNRIVPVYPLTAGITQNFLRKIMFQVVPYWGSTVSDHLPEKLKEKAGLLDLNQALVQIHFPDNPEKLKAARDRISFDEIFFLQLGVLKQKYSWQTVPAEVYAIPDEDLDALLSRLPFQLTMAQTRVLGEVRTNLASGKPMNRLIQGDVGSGKTIIATLAAFIVNRNGGQVAFMAPTSILAEQHYHNLCSLAQTLSQDVSIPQPQQIRLLIGSTPEDEKSEILAGLRDGSIRLVIGTHALIEDPIQFNQLQLVIVDEQHRFGVSQRAALRQKGSNPHLLVMTATPIPRSLALTVYGDLDLSVMDELPAGRQPVETHILHPLERERAYQLIRNQIHQGFQAFITYPLVEQGENGDAKAAVEEHQRLQTEIFPGYKLGLLHGRLRPDEKDEVMSRFRSGDYQILVSTSVVEVGVDVPNATVMLVEGAERFGLAQLHQFRGRVGRGKSKSYCLLIPGKEDALENERLAVMAETNDGFLLAERDLEQRGPGEFLGTRQAGYSELKLANIMDVRLIEKARGFAQEIFEQDPELNNPEHQDIFKAMTHFWGDGKGDIS